MQEIINCPSCQRKLQVPESLLGQDVRCPTCGATFVGTANGAPPPVSQAQPANPPPAPPPGRRDDYDRRRYEDEYDDYGADQYRPRRRRHDLAPHRGSAVLTLGILSLVTGLAIILGPIAWSMGHTDMREIRAGRMDPEGEGSTNAGRICGMIGTILGIVGIVFCFLYMILITAFVSSASRF
jgi:hypothetical protein